MKPDELFGQQNPTGYVSFDEIEAAFKTPTQRQADYEPKPDPTAPIGDLSHLADPTGDAFHDFEQIPDDEPTPVDHAHAMRTGERIARLVDTGIDFTLSNFVAKNGESYKADERDLQDIAECWGELAEDKGWSIGPEWSLIILYIMVYGPLVKQAVTDRRMAELEARMQAIEEQQKIIQMAQPAPQPTPQQPQTHTNNGPTPTPNTTSPSPFTYKPNT